MGKLKIISVTGAMPHSACFFDFADIKYQDGWRGFAPAAHRSPVGAGKVYTDDESGRINHSITFEVPDPTLLRACNSVTAQYSSRTYRVLICDCVSFSADVARECGLILPRVNMTPYGLIKILQAYNQYVEVT